MRSRALRYLVHAFEQILQFELYFFYISGANLDEWSAANIVIKANILPPNLYVTLEKRKEKMWNERFKS